MPNWVKVAIDPWTNVAGLVDGRVFRPVSRADRVVGEALSEKVVCNSSGLTPKWLAFLASRHTIFAELVPN